jgi:hypothetical protein
MQRKMLAAGQNATQIVIILDSGGFNAVQHLCTRCKLMDITYMEKYFILNMASYFHRLQPFTHSLHFFLQVLQSISIS